ncbi:MAG: ferritin [Planctomycetaceae bacterium]|nr:ferritin [Planctomycetaceae bacterium]
MISPRLQDALNKQINAELSSSYLYLAMAAWFEAEDLKGMAHWMRVQAKEENGHAERIFDFINDCNGRVSLTAIEAPKAEWKSPWEAFEEAYGHEQKISAMINELMNLAGAEKSGATHDFLEWFVREQVEEESQVQLIVSKLKLVGDNGVGVYLVDQELAKRE